MAEAPEDKSPDVADLAARIDKMREPEKQPVDTGTPNSLALLGLGTTFAGALLGGWYAGTWYDQHYGTHNGSLIGLLVGLVAGSLGAYQLLKPFLGQ